MKAAVAIVGPCEPGAAERFRAAAREGRLGWAGHLDSASHEPSEGEWCRLVAGADAPWVLALCGDEELTPELAREIQERPEPAVPAVSAHRVRVVVRFLGRDIVGGAYRPQIEARLVRREHPAPSVARLGLGARVTDAPLLESALRWRPFHSLEDGLARIDRETSELALTSSSQGHRAHAVDFLVRPPAVLLRELVARGGLRDGIPGFVLATLAAARELILYAKLWEQGLPPQLRQVPSNPTPP